MRVRACVVVTKETMNVVVGERAQPSILGEKQVQKNYGTASRGEGKGDHVSFPYASPKHTPDGWERGSNPRWRWIYPRSRCRAKIQRRRLRPRGGGGGAGRGWRSCRRSSSESPWWSSGRSTTRTACIPRSQDLLGQCGSLVQFNLILVW